MARSLAMTGVVAVLPFPPALGRLAARRGGPAANGLGGGRRTRRPCAGRRTMLPWRHGGWPWNLQFPARDSSYGSSYHPAAGMAGARASSAMEARAGAARWRDGASPRRPPLHSSPPPSLSSLLHNGGGRSRPGAAAAVRGRSTAPGQIEGGLGLAGDGDAMRVCHRPRSARARAQLAVEEP
ncbi:hypothetical protein C2845_PM11G02730 [Panicum miliaceum]|uniref:Uncharacterized protein n=1 Tax=Panicum miliaceum TaxID=4540 RepID=A0A3L6RPY5_PANMI|nr:hypothetical protein C2845_PM11G02730 [Panicum miliaceum]